MTSYPATYSIGMDFRLSQNMAFLTYGVTERFDVSLGLPLVHAAVQARTYNGIIYVGNGWGSQSTTNPNCWCTDTFTPGGPPGTPQQPTGQGLTLANLESDGVTFSPGPDRQC